MATEIYLGNPPQYVIDWIKAHSKPVGNPKTKITFTDGTSQEYDWSGEINKQTMIDAGLRDGGPNTWIKEPTTVEIGSSVTSIGDSAFLNCSGLTSVTIPDSVTSIEYSAFQGCSVLTSVTIPSSVTKFGPYAFANCINLTNVTIPNSVNIIGGMAFSDCSGLTNVTIPNSVTSIESYAFYNCSGLKDMVFSGKDIATVQGMTYYSWELNSGCVIHCTDGDITL